MPRLLALVVLLSTLAAAPPTVRAADWGWGLSSRAGQMMLDPKLSDFRWDTRPQLRYGAELWARRDRLEGGLGVDRGVTRQGTGIPGGTVHPEVDLTSLSASLRWFASSWRGVEPYVATGIGLLRLHWEPERLEVELAGLPQTTTVAFETLHPWIWTGSAGIQWSPHEHMALRVQVDHARFSLDTAHRRDDVIVDETLGFGAWSWSLALAWSPGSIQPQRP